MPLATRNSRIRRKSVFSGFIDRVPSEAVVLEDTSTGRVPASALSRLSQSDPSKEAQFAHLFIDRNSKLLNNCNVSSRVDFDGKRVELVFHSGSKVGAFPLISPLSGKPEVSLIIRPRFGWTGVGSSLSKSGFKVIPKILTHGMLPRTEREVPPWVLSSAVLPRLQGMLEKVSRRFEMVETSRSAPLGSVDWATYVTNRLPAMKFLSVPCRHPDLRRNQELLAAIHFSLRQQLSSLQSQRHSGGAVLVLLQICMDLLRAVDFVSPVPPTRRQLENWFRTPMASEAFYDGLNAITWTAEETGLGGTTDWRGLPWEMSMESFYEAWVETVFERFAHKYGGHMRVGRRRETTTPIVWERPYLGSQKFLLPDIIIEQEERILVVDAKYKDHWQELRQNSWLELEAEIRERHREDLLQVLAYSTLSDQKSTVACLAYPCTQDTWSSLKERNLLSHRGTIYAGRRKIDLLLIAIPIGHKIDELVDSVSLALPA